MKLKTIDLHRLIRRGRVRVRPGPVVRGRSPGNATDREYAEFNGWVAAAGVERDKRAAIMDEYYAAWGWYHEGAAPPIG